MESKGLGIKVNRSKRDIYISQRNVLDLSKRDGHDMSLKERDPYSINRDSKCALVDGRFQKVVEKLIFIFYAQLYIAYRVGLVKEFIHELFSSHMGSSS